MKEGLDVWWDDEIPGQPAECEVEWMHSEDPLFLLYTSGSTGKPKGVLHSTGELSTQDWTPDCLIVCGFVFTIVQKCILISMMAN